MSVSDLSTLHPFVVGQTVYAIARDVPSLLPGAAYQVRMRGVDAHGPWVALRGLGLSYDATCFAEHAPLGGPALEADDAREEGQ